jgi:hypothetical protein
LLITLCAVVAGLSYVGDRAVDIAAACTWTDPRLHAQEWSAAEAVWQANISRTTQVVHPSKAYGGVWLRDSFWTLMALGDVHLAVLALRHFWLRQRPSGQLPTQFATFLDDPQYKPDESTLLFLIWAAWQTRHGGTRPPRPVLTRALAYISSQAHDGLYMSQAGAYASWFDSFRLKHADTLAYNQGLYAVALQSARMLGLGVTERQVARADAAYRLLVDPGVGYLRFSRLLPYHDVSGLIGEFLSLWLFKRPILSDTVVRRTLATQPEFRGGFRVVVAANGAYLSPHAFNVHLFPGDYQNGGSWLLYDYLALAVGQLHHIPGMVARMHDRLAAEFAGDATYHEYLDTDPSSPIYGGEPAIRDGFSWDTFVTRVDTMISNRCSSRA